MERFDVRVSFVDGFANFRRQQLSGFGELGFSNLQARERRVSKIKLLDVLEQGCIAAGFDFVGHLLNARRDLFDIGLRAAHQNGTVGWRQLGQRACANHMAMYGGEVLV